MSIQYDRNIKIGDLVCLISGGPNMSVVRNPASNIDKRVECQWFDKLEILQTAKFSPVVLKEGKKNK